MRASRAAVIVIAKEPVPGQVKTRLCPPCTPHEAARIASAALADTLEAVVAADVPRRVVALEGRTGTWFPAGLDVVAQRGEGLDERLASAFTDVGGPAVLIGMDTPQITPAALEAAIAVLGSPGVDAVLGAAEDGGWWMLGLRDPDPAVLLGVPMSTARTAEAQRLRMRTLGLRFAELPALRDVDRFDDALAVASLAPNGRFASEVRSVGDAVLAGAAP